MYFIPCKTALASEIDQNSSKLYKDKTIHCLEVVNIKQRTNLFRYGKKRLFNALALSPVLPH